MCWRGRRPIARATPYPNMKPKPFTVCFEAHVKNRRVWAVKQGRTWRTARSVSIQVPTSTVYKGAEARQPRAYMVGIGIVRRASAGRLVIS